jgi:2OG-Fe(II) oxygenase superfamily
MSSITLRQDRLIVADDLLSVNDFTALRDQVARSDFRGVHEQRWDRAWRLWDGNPQRGPSVHYDPDRRFDLKGAAYPTGTALDKLIDELRTLSAHHPEVVGAECVDWVALYLCPWLYPVGSALSLHQDSAKYTGSFTFFVHSRWGMHWGGELLVYPPMWSGRGSPAPPAFGQDQPWMSDDNAEDAMVDDIALAIIPRTNRLVLLGDDRPHRVTRVDQNAGAHVRASIAGFFLRAP